MTADGEPGDRDDRRCAAQVESPRSTWRHPTYRRCRNPATDGSSYCHVHADREERKEET